MLYLVITACEVMLKSQWTLMCLRGWKKWTCLLAFCPLLRYKIGQLTSGVLLLLCFYEALHCLHRPDSLTMSASDSSEVMRLQAPYLDRQKALCADAAARAKMIVQQTEADYYSNARLR